jgi:hypothetical protein
MAFDVEGDRAAACAGRNPVQSEGQQRIRSSEVAKALVKFLTSAAAATVLKQNGMDPPLAGTFF